MSHGVGEAGQLFVVDEVRHGPVEPPPPALAHHLDVLPAVPLLLLLALLLLLLLFVLLFLLVLAPAVGVGGALDLDLA
jgi:hypothetical protein